MKKAAETAVNVSIKVRPKIGIVNGLKTVILRYFTVCIAVLYITLHHKVLGGFLRKQRIPHGTINSEVKAFNSEVQGPQFGSALFCPPLHSEVRISNFHKFPAYSEVTPSYSEATS